MQQMNPLIPSFKRLQEEMQSSGLKVLQVAAAANLVFQRCHLGQSQALLIAEYFSELHSPDNAALKGIISDNVVETHSLAKAVQGNLEESTRVLAGLSKKRETLSSEIGGLKVEVKNLSKRAQALQLEIATLEKTKEETNV